MRKLFNVSNDSKNIDIVLLIVRISIAVLMLVHGIPKLLSLFSGNPVTFPDVLGMGSEISLTLTVFAEVFCSILIFIGLGTRLAVIPLIITMLVAGLIIHSSDPFSIIELSLHYLLVYLMLLIMGSGRFSVDGFLSVNRFVTRNKESADEYQLLSNE